MNKILELREKRARAWDATKAFLETKRSGNGLLSAEDAAAYDKMEADVIALGKEVERMERQAALDAEFAQATSDPITNKPATPGEEKTGRASAEYKKSFWNVMRGRTLPNVENALKTGIDSEGGFLVPEEFERTLIQALEEENIIRQLAKIITTGSDRKIPVVATKGHASWVDEEGAIPESDDSFGQVTLSAYKLAAMLKVSDELLSDSVFDIEAYVAQGFAGRIGNREEEAFIVGDGVGKPTGILAATGGAQVGVIAASATAITLDEILDLYHSLKMPYRRSASFLMNDSTVKTVRKLKDNAGQYLWAPSIRENTPDTILGRPLRTSSYVPVIAEGEKTIIFGDISYYWIADREGRAFKRLVELYAATGQIGFLCSQRVDGKLILPEAVKVLQQKAA